MTERSELERTRDIFAHIREILERDGERAEILFNHIQLRILLNCEPDRRCECGKPTGSCDHPVCTFGIINAARDANQ